MPFKLHSKGRRHIPRQRHRVTNWREYDVCLRNRGSLTIWFTPDAIAGWKAQPRTTPGGQRHYSNLAIETALTLRAVFRLALRQSEGLDKLAAIQMLDVHFPTTDGRTLILSRTTEPNVDQKILLRQLGLTLPSQPPPRITAPAPAPQHPQPTM